MTASVPDRWSQLDALFGAAVELPPEQHERFIVEHCASDPTLGAELRVLLHADASGAPAPYLQSVVREAIDTLAPAREAHEAGQHVGAWRVVRTIGEGGMGNVFLVERADGAFEATAALKLVRGGLASPMLARRFRSERQILASLSHPNIARLLDGGTTADGTPYLVMEYVEGLSITTWCDQRALSLAARCRLFLGVTEAVGYAHQQLVVHRDIKPSNILVTPDGTPMLLDFGIATLADVMDQESGEATTLALRLMTPSYASPEQIRGERPGVASDVYALGVLLYELLTGHLPLETRGLTPAELERRAMDEVPPPASTAGPVERRADLRGDLDAILSHALRKQPHQRYVSVEAFAEDLRRYLDGRPITVRRDDWMYRTGKLLRRNALPVAAGSAIALLLLTIAVTNARQARLLATERDRADEGRRTAEAVSDFLVGVFAVSDPNESSGSVVTARALLDSGAVRMERELADQPETRASLALTMARAYRGLGLVRQSRPLSDSSAAIRKRLLPAGHVDIAAALHEQAVQRYDEGDYEAALPLYREALHGFEAAHPEGQPVVADALLGLSFTLDALSRFEEADSVARHVLAMNERLHTPPHEAIAKSHLNLAAVLRHRGLLGEALPHNAVAVEQLRAVANVNPLDFANALNHYGSGLRQLQRAAEALPFIEEAIALQQRVHGGPHAETAASLGNLAGTLAELGRYDDAERARRASLAMMESLFEAAHPYLAATVHSLAGLLHQAGKLGESERTYRRTLALHRAAYPARHPNLGYPLTGLGRVLLEAGRPVDALPLLREAYEARKAGLPAGHWHVAASGTPLGRALTRLGRYDEATRVLTEAVATLTAAFGKEDTRTGEARGALAAVYDARGVPMPDDAAESPVDDHPTDTIDPP